MFWNVQGAASPKFHRAFKTLKQMYKPQLCVLFEPRCSGQKADAFIRKSRYSFSHRVEARGFSGGIWILWTEELTVDVIEDHPQFVSLRVVASNGSWFYITAIYASPSRSIRDQLWGVLHDRAYEMDGPWIVG